MEVIFKYKSNAKLINIDKVNIIIGNNNSGKSSVLKSLYYSLCGNDDTATLNGVKLQKGMLNPINICNERDLTNEVQLKAGSIVNEKIVKRFIRDNHTLFKENLSEFISQANQLIGEEYNTDFNFNLSNSNLVISDEKLKKFNFAIFEILFENQPSSSALEEYYIRQHIDITDEVTHKVVLIDDIDKCLDYDSINKLIDSYPDVSFVFTSKNKYILNEVKFDNIYTTSINRIDLYETAKLEFFKNEISKDSTTKTLDDFIIENNNLFFEEDFNKFLKENIHLVVKNLKI